MDIRRFLKLVPVALICALAFAIVGTWPSPRDATATPEPQVIELPSPWLISDVSLEEALTLRRSTRSFSNSPLSLRDLAQLLWAAQGITQEKRGFRTAPSAGALFPLEVYAVASNVDGLANGIYKYQPCSHELVLVKLGEHATGVYDAALQQESIRDAPVVICIAGVVERTSVKYGARAERYMLIEVGHAGQNICLQTAALGLGAVTIGAFNDDTLKTALRLPAEEKPLYVIPVGHP